MEDVLLQIKIDNKKPVELISITSSLLSLNNQYISYVKYHASENIKSEARLYVKEIKKGSMIFELVDIAIGVLPFMETTNTIIGFANYCCDMLGYFLGKSDRDNVSINDSKDYSNFVNPIIADNNAVIHIGTVINGNYNLMLGITNTEANAIQNTARLEIEKLSAIDRVNLYKQVLMTWEQASSDIKNNTKNKGVIDSIFPNKAFKVLFENEDIKSAMLYGDNNPLTCVYEVDVRVETSQNKPVAYRITHLYQIFDA